MRLVLDLGLDDRFHVVSWSGELAPYYRSLDVYVSSSQTEAFGLSIVEAMASGRAVIATATEGAREIIEDNMTGIIVPIGNAEKIAGAIEAVLDDAGERVRLGGNASDDVRERFGQDRMVDEIERVYFEVVKGK
jgi:glycosyltransferase involved in cell wall biosynthesis